MGILSVSLGGGNGLAVALVLLVLLAPFICVKRILHLLALSFRVTCGLPAMTFRFIDIEPCERTLTPHRFVTVAYATTLVPTIRIAPCSASLYNSTAALFGEKIPQY